MSAAPGVRTQDRPCADGLEQSALRLHRRAVPREAAFWLVGYVFAAVILGTALPVPLYAIYQRQWHFSSGVLTLIFAVYAVAVLATLLLAGQASDQAGRKPVLAAALCFSVASTVVFIFAASPGLALPGPDLVRGVGRPDDGRRHRGAQRDGPGLGLAAGVDGSHDREQRRRRPGPAHGRAVRPVPAAADRARLRGLPGLPRRRGAGPGLHTGDGDRAGAAEPPVHRPRHPRGGPRRVHRRRSGRFRRLRAERAVRVAGARIHDRHAASSRLRGRGRRHVPLLRGRRRRGARPGAVQQQAGPARRARVLPCRAGAGRSRDVGGIPGAVPGRRRRGRERLRRSGHRQPVRRQPAGGAAEPAPR